MIGDPIARVRRRGPMLAWSLLLGVGSVLGAALAPAQDPATTSVPAEKAEKKETRKAARQKRERPKEEDSQWGKMNYGPFLTASVKVPTPGNDNNANKGVVVHLGDKEHPAAICFDTDLLRVAGGWTGGFVNLLGTPFDGSHGSWPTAKGTPVFGTKPGPGWAKGDDFKDPRSEPFGPLPADWAKYKGLYRSGDHIVFSYTVGGTSVLEMPAAVQVEGHSVLTRTFNIAPTRQPLTLVVADVEGGQGGAYAPGSAEATNNGGRTDDQIVALTAGDQVTLAGVTGAPKGSTWKILDDGRVLLQLAASPLPVDFRLAIARTPKTDSSGLAKHLISASGAVANLTKFTKGGPARWTETVTTKGTLGTGDGPYVVDTITAPDQNPYQSWIRFGGMDFFKGGTKAALSTWSGDVWVVAGIDDKLEKLTWKRFATGLFQPLGLKIVDEKVYVLGRDGISRLNDLDGDGEADFYEAFNHDMAATTGFHEFAMDLQTDPEGNFYFAKAAPVKGGGRGFDYIAANSGTVMKVSKDGKTLSNYATGFRAPNGIGVGPTGQLTSGDNEGTWMPKCRLNWINPGGFYGVVDTAHRDDKPTMYDEPICWFPKDVDNSSGGQTWVTSNKWGPFGGRLLHTSYGTCSLFLALVDQQDGHIQGGVARFPVNFLTGIMRPKFNDHDGQLYVAGLRGWQSSAATDAAFQRVRYTGKPANMVTGLKVKKGEIDLTFTDPVDPEDATDADSFEIEQWNYLWCSEYGSDDYSAEADDYQDKVRELNKLRADRSKSTNPDERAKFNTAIEALTKSFTKGHSEVDVKAAKLSEDKKTVTLTIPDLKPVMQMKIRARLKSADGKRIPVEVYNTINYVPGL